MVLTEAMTRSTMVWKNRRERIPEIMKKMPAPIVSAEKKRVETLRIGRMIFRITYSLQLIKKKKYFSKG